MLKDARGNELRLWEKVAYNLSGEVHYGEIVGIDEGERKTVVLSVGSYEKTIKRPLIKVRNLNGATADGHISKIRNERNLLVIYESE